MPERDRHDLERRLRDARSEPDAQFVQRVTASVGRRQHSTPRPRLTLAFAVTMALLASMIAFGGVGAAKNAINSSTSAVRSAVGESAGKHSNSGSHEPFAKQYHRKVLICWPKHHKRHVELYVTRRVSARSVPSLVSKGAIYPVPVGGCSSLQSNHADGSSATSSG
jgi:hypothetical protein